MPEVVFPVYFIVMVVLILDPKRLGWRFRWRWIMRVFCGFLARIQDKLDVFKGMKG